MLREGSPGAAQPRWDRLPNLPMPVRFVAGELDTKFANLAVKMAALTDQNSNSTAHNGIERPLRSKENMPELRGSTENLGEGFQGRGAIIVEECGHAIHTERPEALVPIIRNFVHAAGGPH